jgi:membrane protein
VRQLGADIPHPAEEAARSGGWMRLGRRIVVWLVSGFLRVRANDLAAGIAYYALLTIVPILLGLVSLVGLVLRTDEGFRQAEELVTWIVPGELAAESLQTLPALRDRSGTFGLFSLLGFLWLGSTLFSAVGRAMNQVYGVPDRPPLHQRLRGLIGVLAFALLFIASVIAAIVPTVVLGIDQHSAPLDLADLPVFRGLYQLLSYVVAVVTSMVMFGLIFRLAPAAGQRVADIVPGAVVIGLAFVVLVQVFPFYLRIVNGWNLIGGTAGLLSLVLLWFYLLAHLLVLGAYINATWQRHRRTGDPW